MKTNFTKEEKEMIAAIEKANYSVTVWDVDGNLPEMVVCTSNRRSVVKFRFESLLEAKNHLAK